MTDQINNPTSEPLEPIISDLLNEVFENAVSLEDIAEHLIDLGGIDLHDIPVEMLLAAIKDTELEPISWNDHPQINWNRIRFGCNETLARCNILSQKPEQLWKNPDEEFGQLMDMCAYFLATGLIASALNHDNIYSGLDVFYRYTIAPFGLYAHLYGPPFIDDQTERLLRYIIQATS